MGKFMGWVKKNWLETISAVLMILGIIFAFFYPHIGGALVGLGFGFCFATVLHGFFSKTKEYYTTYGLYKTLMLAGTALFLLIVQPAFLIATLVGFAVVTLLRLKKPKHKK